MRKFLSISLSLLILLGNMGFTLATHYCGGHAVETQLTVGEAHIGCGMEEDSMPCEAPVILSKNCCNDDYLSISLDEDFNSQTKQLSISPVFLFSFTYTYLNLQSSTEVAPNLFRDEYHPPPNQSRQVLFQTFLI